MPEAGRRRSSAGRSWSEAYPELCSKFRHNRRSTEDCYDDGPRNQALHQQVAAGARRLLAHRESEEAEVDISRPDDDDRAGAIQPNPGENEGMNWRHERPDRAQADQPQQPGTVAREEEIHRPPKGPPLCPPPPRPQAR